MVIAGIDEAGYGPILGPLVVGSAAMRVEDSSMDEIPDLWKRCKSIVSKKRDPSGRKLHINDSKLVYTPTIGLFGLEKSVMAIHGVTANRVTANLNELIEKVSPRKVNAFSLLDELPWYQMPEDEKHPITCDAMSLKLAQGVVARGLADVGITGVELRADVVCEARLNDWFQKTNNKGSTLASISMSLLDGLLERHATKDGLLVVCDRQGGRTHYGPLLRTMFDQWSLIVVKEEDGFGEYTLTRGQAVARIIFAEKSEQLNLPTALASMLCKYLRERLMMRLSRYWQLRVPGLEATAGYWTDGLRFMKDIDQACKSEGIDPKVMVRSR